MPEAVDKHYTGRSNLVVTRHGSTVGPSVMTWTWPSVAKWRRRRIYS
jgi:hypothetical protein